MPTCAPNYLNVGYKEYFNATGANCQQYTNGGGNACVQYCPANATTYNRYGNAYTPACTEARCAQSYINAFDDCAQYYNYSNYLNYTRNVSGAGAYSLGLNTTLIDSVTTVDATAISAIKHMRDKLVELVNNKPQQSTVPETGLTAVSDATFDDGNPSTIEKTAAAQYNALQSKFAALRNAINTGVAVSSTQVAPGDTLTKNHLTALKTDLTNLAAACYQTYANQQVGAGYANANSAYTRAVYGASVAYTNAYCAEYICTNTGSGCGQYNYSDYSNCTNTLSCGNCRNSGHYNYSNYSNHANHSNHSNYSNVCRRDY